LRCMWVVVCVSSWCFYFLFLERYTPFARFFPFLDERRRTMD